MRLNCEGKFKDLVTCNGDFVYDKALEPGCQSNLEALKDCVRAYSSG